jgi:parvulin-like peptidyl-prolyl isomerase
MMRQLRESTKVIMVVVAVSFVALMVFDWAMDLSGRGPGASADAIGRVNGREISADEFQRQLALRMEEAREASPDGSVSEDQIAAFQDQAWETMVNAALLREEAERRGLSVTDEEVLAYVEQNPPPEFRASPAFQTDGVFDMDKYRAALANPELAPTWALYESTVRDELPLRKLQDQVLAGVAVTDREVEDAWRAANEQVRVRYLYLDPGILVPDSAVAVTEEELRAAYEERKEEDFARRASARLTIASWPAATTAADTARVRTELDSLRARALAGEDFAELAREASQDPGSARRGGDLGFFTRGQMVPEFDRVAWSLPEDSVSQPFSSPFGWHVVKAGPRDADTTGVERLRASHILLRVEPSEDTFAALEDGAAALAERAEGLPPDSMAALARAAGAQVTTTPPFEQSPFIPGVGRAPEIADWAFESPAGAVSEPIRSGSSVYVVRVDERTPAGFLPFETVRNQVRSELLLERKLERAKDLEERATSLVRERGLDGAARELGLSVVAAGPFTREARLPQLGDGQEPFIGAAFGLEPGQVSGPIRLANGTYHLATTERVTPDLADFESQREAWRQQLLARKAQLAANAWIESMREAAEVEDYRAEILRAASEPAEDAGAPQPPPVF